MSDRKQKLLSLFMTLVLVLSTVTLAGCGGGGADEQDNCYGEDMPVVND